MSSTVLATFWLVSFLFAITPGADWAHAISAGIRGRMVLPAVGGLLLSHSAATVLVAAGVGALIVNIPFALTLLTVAGAGYLLWLGTGLIRHPATPATQFADTHGGARQWFLKGIAVSGLNPKVLLIFLAVVPQFSDPQGSWPLFMQLLVLGGLHVATSGVVYTLVGYGSQAVLKARPAAASLVSQASGGIMTGIGLLLLAEPIMQKI